MQCVIPPIPNPDTTHVETLQAVALKAHFSAFLQHQTEKSDPTGPPFSV
jgi:hypothetical protein